MIENGNCLGCTAENVETLHNLCCDCHRLKLEGEAEREAYENLCRDIGGEG